MTRNADQLFTAGMVREAQAAADLAAGSEASAVIAVLEPYIQEELNDRQGMIQTAMGVAGRGAAAQNILDDVKAWLVAERDAGQNQVVVNELYRIILGINL